MKIFNSDDAKLLIRSLEYAKKYKLQYVLLVGSIVIFNILNIIQPLYWGKVIQAITEKNTDVLYNSIFIVTILITTKLIINYINSILSVKINSKMYEDIKRDIFKNVLELSMENLSKIKSGQIIAWISSDSRTICDILNKQFLSIGIDTLRTIILLIAIFTINVKLSLIIILFSPISYGIFIYFGKKLKLKNLEYKKIYDSELSIIQQCIKGIKYIKVNKLKKLSVDMFLTNSNKFKLKTIEIASQSAFADSINGIFNFISKILLALLGFKLILTNNITLAVFIAFTSYSDQITSSITSLSQANSIIIQSMVSLKRVFNVIDNIEYSKEYFGDKDISNIKGGIVFSNVNFSYGSNKILKNASFSILPKRLNVIFGKSGVGKSTIFNLILKLYKAESGNIFIDDYEIEDISENALRENIELVDQEPFFFNLSIKDNLILGKDNIMDEEIFSICKKVNIHDYIISLKYGYDTMLLENTVNLSIGQKQRLAIARAILSKKSIILLDEPTSSLDYDSKKIIENIIKELSHDRTVIVITHDKKFLKLADNQIIIDSIDKIKQISSNLCINDIFINI